MDDDTLTNIIKKFGREYLGISDREPFGDVEKIEQQLRIDYSDYRKKWTQEIENGSGYFINDENGPYMNKLHFQKCMNSNIEQAFCVEKHHGYLLAEEPIIHTLYPPFKEFLRYFPNGPRIINRRMHIDKIKFQISDENLMCGACELTFEPMSTTADEWVKFFSDWYAPDDGGELYINLNPNSEYYGRVAALLLQDEISAQITEFQFEDWLELMVSCVGHFLNEVTQDKDNQKSIVKIFIGFWPETLSRKDYLRSRWDKAIAQVNEYIPKCLASIVGDYESFDEPPTYEEIDFWENKDYAYRAGVTDEIYKKYIIEKNIDMNRQTNRPGPYDGRPN